MLKKLFITSLFLFAVGCYEAKRNFLDPVTPSGSAIHKLISDLKSNSKILPAQVAPPSFSPNGGIYSFDQFVSISTITPDATIYYTTDGSIPTSESNLYTEPIPISGHGTSVTLKAIATKPELLDSEVESQTYNIQYSTVAIPIFSPNPGVHTALSNISISITTPGATIYYTIDGSIPTTSSTLYTLPLENLWSLAGKTIQAFAVKSGMLDSPVAIGVYSYPPFKTGKVVSDGPGDDGALKKGLARSFTDNGDETVTDETTGLIWQKCQAGKSGSFCTGTPQTFDFSGALNYCNTLSLAGKVWRLPTRQELETLLNYGTLSPATYTSVFPSTFSGNFRTSTEDPSDSTKAWSVVFTNGILNVYDKTTVLHFVRCVSGPFRDYVRNFLDNGDGTVLDRSTGLVWQKCLEGQTYTGSACTGSSTVYTWSNALNYCNNLSLAGKTWRLPNINELKTLFDPTSTPAIDPIFSNGSTWSSTSFSSTSAWMSQSDSKIFNFPKTASYAVRCVSGH